MLALSLKTDSVGKNIQFEESRSDCLSIKI